MNRRNASWMPLHRILPVATAPDHVCSISILMCLHYLHVHILLNYYFLLIDFISTFLLHLICQTKDDMVFFLWKILTISNHAMGRKYLMSGQRSHSYVVCFFRIKIAEATDMSPSALPLVSDLMWALEAEQGATWVAAVVLLSPARSLTLWLWLNYDLNGCSLRKPPNVEMGWEAAQYPGK